MESLREEQLEEAYALLEALAEEVDPEPEEREALREEWAEYQAGKAILLEELIRRDGPASTPLEGCGSVMAD